MTQIRSGGAPKDFGERGRPANEGAVLRLARKLSPAHRRVTCGSACVSADAPLRATSRLDPTARPPYSTL